MIYLECVFLTSTSNVSGAEKNHCMWRRRPEKIKTPEIWRSSHAISDANHELLKKPGEMFLSTCGASKKCDFRCTHNVEGTEHI